MKTPPCAWGPETAPEQWDVAELRVSSADCTRVPDDSTVGLKKQAAMNPVLN